MSYELSICISGAGLDSQNRSHWSFFIRRCGHTQGDLLQVLVIDLDRLWYQFEERAGEIITLPAIASEGRIVLTTCLTESQRLQAKSIIKDSPAPRNGKDRCQDWVLDTLIELQIEGIVEYGTAEMVGAWVGMSARDVAVASGVRWKPMMNIT